MTDMEQKTCANCNRTFKSPEDFYAATSRWRLCDRKNLWFNCNCGSTLMLPSGKFSWYTPDHALRGNAKSVFNILSKFGSLPHIPSSVMDIQQMLQNPSVEMADLAKKIRGEPFIAANILSLANNIKSNRDPHDRQKISTLEHAVIYVGKKTVSELVLTIGLKSFSSTCKIFDSEQFWKDSFLCGNIAEQLCLILKYPLSRDEIFIGATLCNIGKFVESFYLPDTLDRIEQTVSNPKTLCTWESAEKSIGSPEHCVLGEIGATLWGLPLYVVEAAIGHHKLRSDESHSSHPGLIQTEVIALANQMTHWVLLRPSRIDQALLEKLREFANISKKDLDDIGLSLSPLANLAS